MKLRSLIKYQCWTTIKPVLCFYGILYGIITVGYIISFIATGTTSSARFYGVEISCFIYLAITGSLGFNEDFKMAIQNGFTRKQIFLAALGMFAFLTIIMSFVDTLITQIIREFSPTYMSFFQQIYGLGHNILIQWVILMLIYFAVAISAYLFTLLCNKIGKKLCYFILTCIVLVMVVIVPLVMNLYVPEYIAANFLTMLTRAIGFTAGGSVQFINPFILLSIIVLLISGFSYITMKKTELK